MSNQETSQSNPYVFVSYSHEDSKIVEAEIRKLKSAGLDIRFDADFTAPEHWAEKVAPQMREAAALLFYVSPGSIQSSNCNDEIDYARTNQLPILLAYLSETQLPPGWELRIGRRQALYRHRETPKSYWGRLNTRLANYLNPSESLRKDTDMGSDPSIAILPFTTLAGGAALTHVADSIAMESHALLDQQSGIRMIALSSTFARGDSQETTAEIGASLGADAVLTGTIVERSSEFEIEVKLMGVGVSIPLNEVSFTSPDISELRDQVAGFVVEHYQHRIRRSESASLRVRTESIDAYGAFVEGQRYWYRQDWQNMWKAIQCYEEATKHDPDCFDAYLGMVSACLVLHSMGTPKEMAITAANTAIENARRVMHHVDSRSRQELSLRAAYCYRTEHWMVGLGEEELIVRLMLESNPSDYSAYGEYGEGILMHSGFYREAIEYLKVGEAHDPRNIMLKQSLAMLLGSIGNYAEAMERLNDTLALDAENALSLTYRSCILARMGDREGTEVDLQRIKGMAQMQMGVFTLLSTNCYRLLGDPRGEMLHLSAEASSPIDRDCEYPFLTGLGCFGQDQFDLGFAYWDLAREKQDRLLHHLRTHTTFFLTEDTARKIAADHRYHQLLNGIAMGPQWIAEVDRRARTLTALTGIAVGEPWFP